MEKHPFFHWQKKKFPKKLTNDMFSGLNIVLISLKSCFVVWYTYCGVPGWKNKARKKFKFGEKTFDVKVQKVKI